MGENVKRDAFTVVQSLDPGLDAVAANCSQSFGYLPEVLGFKWVEELAYRVTETFSIMLRVT